MGTLPCTQHLRVPSASPDQHPCPLGYPAPCPSPTLSCPVSTLSGETEQQGLRGQKAYCPKGSPTLSAAGLLGQVMPKTPSPLFFSRWEPPTAAALWHRSFLGEPPPLTPSPLRSISQRKQPETERSRQNLSFSGLPCVGYPCACASCRAVK